VETIHDVLDDTRPAILHWNLVEDDWEKACEILRDFINEKGSSNVGTSSAQ
jgi:hypothetical protein